MTVCEANPSERVRMERLGDICEIWHGGTPSKSNADYWNGDIPWVSPKDMRSPRIATTRDSVTAAGVAGSSTRVVPAGSLLVVVRSGILARTLPVAIADVPVTFNQDMKSLTPDTSRVLGEYLYWLLRSMEGDVLQNGVKKGATVHSVKSGFIENLRIPLPPLGEQRRIAARLSEHMAHIARARAAAEERLRYARSLSFRILREVFADAADWPLLPLREVCTFIRGVSFKKHEATFEGSTGLVAVLRAGNINGVLNLSNDLVWVPDRKVSDEQRLRVGDIAICMSSGSPAVVGKTAALEDEWTGTVGAFCGIIRPTPNVCAQYLALWFRSAQFIEWRDSQARGANIQNLRFSQLEALEIACPPLAEQHRIAARLTEQMESINTLTAAIERELAKIDLLPAVLLREAFGDS